MCTWLTLSVNELAHSVGCSGEYSFIVLLSELGFIYFATFLQHIGLTREELHLSPCRSIYKKYYNNLLSLV